MSFSGAKSGVTGNILSSDITGAERTAMAPFGEALIREAEANPRIVGLTADLGKYTDIHLFANRFP
jgi:transketolase